MLDIELPGLTEKSFPGNPDRKQWSGYLDVPHSGKYNLRINAIDRPQNAVTLVIDGTAVQIHHDGGGIWNADSIPFTAGRLSAISVDIAIAPVELELMWESTGLDWQIIPGIYLYSDERVDQIRTNYIRFLKATSLASALSLTADEIAYLASHSDFAIQNDGWINSLPVSGSPDHSTSCALRDILMTLLDFAQIKKELSPSDGRTACCVAGPLEDDSRSRTRYPNAYRMA